MDFQWPNMLWLLLLVPVLIAAYVWAQKRRQRYAVRYASLSLVKEALGKGPGIRRHIPPLLFLFGLIAMIIAHARPIAVVKLPSEEGTVILTMDTSGSMQADDINPTRMEAAKAAARTFVQPLLGEGGGGAGGLGQQAQAGQQAGKQGKRTNAHGSFNAGSELGRWRKA